MTTTPMIAPTLNLAYADQIGRVVIRADNMAAADTVYRVGVGRVLQPVRGYSDRSSWHVGATGVAYDYEFPVGALTEYAIAPVGQIRLPIAWPTATIRTPGDQAWLRDPANPILSQRVQVVSVTESEAARQTTYAIAGKRAPVVVHDVRAARTGDLVLLVINAYDENGTQIRQPRDAINELLASGNVLLFAMCYTKGVEVLYLAVSDAEWSRVGEASAWQLTLGYTEVDNPRVGITIPPELIYDVAKDLPKPKAVYRDWFDTYRDYADLLLNRPTAAVGP